MPQSGQGQSAAAQDFQTFGQPFGPLDNGQFAPRRQQISPLADQLFQVQVQFMPGGSLFRLAADMALSLFPKRGVAQDQLGTPPRQAFIDFPDIGLHNFNPVLQSIQADTAPGSLHHAGLQFYPDNLDLRSPHRQQKGDHPAAGAQINRPLYPGQFREMSQQHRIQRETIPLHRLDQFQAAQDQIIQGLIRIEQGCLLPHRRLTPFP